MFEKFLKNDRILHDSCPKNYQYTRIFMIFARKKITKFRILHDFCPKNVRILHNNRPKNIFPEFLGGTCPPSLPTISYAYANFIRQKYKTKQI